MGCLRRRRKLKREFTDHKWDYINLADFKAKGCGPGFVYGYLWFSLFLSIAVYSIDSFTAVNLLAFNKWSSKIEPAIPFDVSKWIFSICIIASFVNLAYEGVRAVRVMRRRNVAECYMDSLAARWESIRPGRAQGWRRFLVFAELTKSKRGAEYIALFTYFSLQSWIRVILCSGPRQVVNALTLRSVYVAKLAPTSDSVEGSIVGFFDKIKALAEEDYQQAVILSGMCFTLVVWIFSALYLLAAVLFYVLFLFHWIPRADGGLTGYCERKVNKRLTSIVTTKVNRALAKGQARRERAEALAMAARCGEKKAYPERAVTLPTIPNVGGPVGSGSLAAAMPVLSRSDTKSSLALHSSSRPATPNSFELTSMDRRRPLHLRSGTMDSASSYSSRAPLVGAAADMGYGMASPELRTPPGMDLGSIAPPRPGTPGPQRSLVRTGHGPTAGPLNGGSISSLRNRVTASPAPMEREAMAPLGGAPGAYPAPRTHGLRDGVPRPMAAAPTYDAYSPDGRSSPAPPPPAGAYRTGAPAASRPPWAAAGGPAPQQQPARSMTGPVPPALHGPQHPPHRNMTAPLPAHAATGEYFELPGPPPRTGTAQGTRGQQGQHGPGRGGGGYGYDGETPDGYGYQ